jgi:hypothetical protein
MCVRGADPRVAKAGAPQRVAAIRNEIDVDADDVACHQDERRASAVSESQRAHLQIVDPTVGSIDSIGVTPQWCSVGHREHDGTMTDLHVTTSTRSSP